MNPTANPLLHPLRKEPDLRHRHPYPQTARASMALLDGRNAFGHLVAHHGMRAAVRMAHASGLGLVSVRNSNHFGMSASYVLQWPFPVMSN